MDFKQLEYILMIAEEQNITHAAEKLFISQSALNQQLLKLEKELGCQLFHRSRTDWHATKEGEIYIEGARKAMAIRRDTYARINDSLHSGNTTLRLGLAPGRGFDLLEGIYPRLHERFPKLSVLPNEMIAHRQIEAVRKGDIDLGYLTLSDPDRSDDYYIDMGKEEVMLVLPVSHPLAQGIDKSTMKLETLDLKEVTDIPFAVTDSHTTSRALTDRIFKNAGVSPDILFESTSVRSIVDIVKLGFCGGIVPAYYLSPEDKQYLTAFHIPGRPQLDLCIIARKNSYMTDAAHAFIGLAVDYLEKHAVVFE